jgi:hypothetical protein
MPAPLRAAETRKAGKMNCSWCEKPMTGGRCLHCGLSAATATFVARESGGQVTFKSGDVVFEIPVEEARRLTQYRRQVAIAPASSKSKTAETPIVIAAAAKPAAVPTPGGSPQRNIPDKEPAMTVATPDAIVREALRATAGVPGSEPERIAAYFAEHPGVYRRYRNASYSHNAPPLPASEFPPEPISLTEAERQFTANPKKPGVAMALVEARVAAAQVKDPKLTYSVAVDQVFADDPDLYPAYRRDARYRG